MFALQDTLQDGRAPKGMHTSTHMTQQVLVIASQGAELNMAELRGCLSPFKYFPSVGSGPCNDTATDGG